MLFNISFQNIQRNSCLSSYSINIPYSIITYSILMQKKLYSRGKRVLYTHCTRVILVYPPSLPVHRTEIQKHPSWRQTQLQTAIYASYESHFPSWLPFILYLQSSPFLLSSPAIVMMPVDVTPMSALRSHLCAVTAATNVLIPDLHLLLSGIIAELASVQKAHAILTKRVNAISHSTAVVATAATTISSPTPHSSPDTTQSPPAPRQSPNPTTPGLLSPAPLETPPTRLKRPRRPSRRRTGTPPPKRPSSLSHRRSAPPTPNTPAVISFSTPTQPARHSAPSCIARDKSSAKRSSSPSYYPRTPVVQNPPAVEGFATPAQAARAAANLRRRQQSAPRCAGASRDSSRRSLPAVACPECCAFFRQEAAASQDPEAAYERLVNKACRHRYEHPRQSTPEGYWDLSFDETQTQPPPPS